MNSSSGPGKTDTSEGVPPTANTSRRMSRNSPSDMALVVAGQAAKAARRRSSIKMLAHIQAVEEELAKAQQELFERENEIKAFFESNDDASHIAATVDEVEPETTFTVREEFRDMEHFKQGPRVHDDRENAALAQPALRRATGRDMIPETQPGAVAVRPSVVYPQQLLGVGIEAESVESSVFTNVQDIDAVSEIPRATPIRASVVRREEASKDELDRLQQEMEAKEQEMVQMQLRLAEMEQMKRELNHLRVGMGIAVAEPIPGRASAPTHMPIAHAVPLPRWSPSRMTPAEFLAYQILIGNESSSRREKSITMTSLRSLFSGTNGSKSSSKALAGKPPNLEVAPEITPFTERPQTQPSNPERQSFDNNRVDSTTSNDRATARMGSQLEEAQHRTTVAESTCCFIL